MDPGQIMNYLCGYSMYQKALAKRDEYVTNMESIDAKLGEDTYKDVMESLTEVKKELKLTMFTLYAGALLRPVSGIWMGKLCVYGGTWYEGAGVIAGLFVSGIIEDKFGGYFDSLDDQVGKILNEDSLRASGEYDREKLLNFE